jgi:hypothetical protein
MARVLDAERPDLVIFTGDNLSGSMPDPEASIRAYAQPAVDRQIPWVRVARARARSFVLVCPSLSLLPGTRQLSLATTTRTRVSGFADVEVLGPL